MTQRLWIFIVPLFALSILLVGCGEQSKPTLDKKPGTTVQRTVTVETVTEDITLVSPEGAEHVLSVEIADDAAKQAQGLMNRTSLDEGKGMLFVFGRERSLSFWMKNTLIPLDIIFFNAAGEFVSDATMYPCTAEPCDRYPSNKPSQFALEVNAGVINDLGIGEGWMLKR